MVIANCDWCKGTGQLGPPEDLYECPKCATAAQNYAQYRKGFESMEKLHESLKESGE